MFDERQYCVGTAGLREVDGDRALAPVEKVLRPRHQLQAAAAGSVDADHVGAQIREQHSAERSRADTGYLENLHAGQGTGRHIDPHSPRPARINSQL